MKNKLERNDFAENLQHMAELAKQLQDIVEGLTERSKKLLEKRGERD